MLTAQRDLVCLALRDEVALIKHSTASLCVITIPKSEKLNNTDVILCAASTSETYFCCCDANKRLLVYSLVNGKWDLRHTYMLQRLPSSLCLDPDEECALVGDKSGTVYRYPLEAAKSDQTDFSVLMMGHGSMLTDMAISDDRKLIATSDRDEKVRISRFLEPYVIESFCLGHTSFVTHVTFLPNSHYLISAGGDHTLCLWQAGDGCLISSLSLEEFTPGRLKPSDRHSEHQPSEEKDIIVSYLRVGKQNVCVGAVQSPPFLFAVRVHPELSKTSNTFWGPVSIQPSPNSHCLLDVAVSYTSDTAAAPTVFSLLQSKPLSLVCWSLELDESTNSLLWNSMKTVGCVEEFLNSHEPTHITNERMKLLSSLTKSECNKAGINAYLEQKQAHHKVVLERRRRHQHSRRKNKHLLT